MTANLFPPTRFDHLTRGKAISVVVLVLLAITMGIVWGVAEPKAFRTTPVGLGGGDSALYARINADVTSGEPYYHAAVREQRRWGYVLKPALTVREPTLAMAMAKLADVPARRLALRLLSVVVLIVWGWRIHTLYGKPVFTVLAVLSFADLAYLFHECWAGLLIVLSLGLYHPRRWGPSVAIGFLAVMVRELALPYLAMMAVFAIFERRRGEALAWALAIGFFAAFMIWHGHQVAALLQPGDRSSHGWLAFGGWPFLLLLTKWNGLLICAPSLLVASVVPLMLVGAVGWGGGLGARVAGLCFGYSIAFLVVGRLDNAYWGLFSAPIMALSLPWAIQSMGDVLGVLSGNLRKCFH